ncbi:MAG: hypothetical protein HKL98_11785 [Burkholderiales bacterium]|nr:hypothetical protein [Burkholderiales bacterium]
MNRTELKPSVRLICTSDGRVAEVLAEHCGRVLGVISYSASEPDFSSGDLVHSWVELEVLGEETCHEIWVSENQVSVHRQDGFEYSCDGDFLFCSHVQDECVPQGLERAAHSAYAGLFDLLDRSGYPFLLRAWNYFPGINDAGEDIERYREFNAGRHEAFCEKGRIIEEGSVPAACALGTRRGNLVICSLAGRSKGVAIENPRQVNAYRYPGKYGPKSPTFSRGMLAGDALLISGTASIVGAETMHPGDVMRQLEETLENLRVVGSMARREGFAAEDFRGLCLNVYLRSREDLDSVRKRLQAEFGPNAKIFCMQAEICRADLLVEIEAFWMVQREAA